ncbi:MAG TPA: LPS assembly lipoprotein LptE [Steroidobacteraceae bacterium]|jgi:LPS-assembly lipoprotein|nr:LPS assembly lipoprotein LptE [Steroidobacteraceae bacterium]
MRILVASLACAVASGVTSCGFRLQGHTPLPSSFKVSYVDAHDRQSDFVQGLRSALLISGVVLTEDATAATATVHVLDDKHVLRTLSVSPDNLPREYELTYSVRFSVTSGDKELLESQEVSTSREYSFAVSELLAKQNEEAILQAALAHDLVEVVMRRLSSLQVK